MKKTGFFNGKTVRKSLRIIAIMALFCLLVGVGSADNNTTVLDNLTVVDNVSVLDNQTLVDNETIYVIPYRHSEQYVQDVETWYQYYKSINFVQELRGTIYSYLIDSSLSWEDKQNVIKPLIGWDFRLETYMDSSKCTVNEETGECSYDLGISNWFAKLFGNGIEESLLPQTIAEGDALYKIYQENFTSYIQALHDAGDP